MVKIKQNINKNSIAVASGKTGGTVIAGTDASIYYSNLSKEWACKMPASVDGTEYSAKYYMEKTKQKAIDSISDIGDAKDDAIQAMQDAGDEILDSATEIYNQTVDKAAEIADAVLNSADVNFSNITAIAQNIIAKYGNSHHIGEIVSSTIPLTDAGLHLLDGALISGSGSYSDFVDYIADLYDSGNYTAIFDTEANWQSAVTQYGVCGKFVYDSVNNTVRLPKLGSLVYTTNDNTASIIPVSVYGTGKALGLTDGSTLAGLQNFTSSSSHHLYARVESYDTSVGTIASGSTNYLSSTSVGVTTDATKSGLTGNANTSNIIVNNSVNCYYYIVVAISTNTQIQVDIDEIATDLNGKADVDLSNITHGCKVLDGQWVNSALTVADGASCPATSASVPTYDLSSYLPNDNYNYEVLFDVAVTTGTTSGNFSRVSLCSDLITNDTDVCYVRTRSSSSVNAAGNCILAVGTGRSISLGYYSSNTGTYTLRARGYRRIGTNT